MFEAFKRVRKRLTREERRRITRAYGRAVNEVGEAEFEYVTAKIDAKIQILCSSMSALNRDLGNCCKQLYDSLAISGDELASSTTERNLVIAALHYVIDPLDVIVDFEPSRGYLDDVFVINLCLRELRKVVPERWSKSHWAKLEKEQAAVS